MRRKGHPERFFPYILEKRGLTELAAFFDRAEVESTGYERTNARAIIYCSNIRKAQEHLAARGARPGPIGELGGMQFFEIQDCEGNGIEICMEE